MPVVSRVGGRKKHFSSKRKTRKTKTKKSRKSRKSGKSKKSKKSRKHRRRGGKVDFDPPRLNVSGAPAGAVGYSSAPTKRGLLSFGSRKRSVTYYQNMLQVLTNSLPSKIQRFRLTLDKSSDATTRKMSDAQKDSMAEGLAWNTIIYALDEAYPPLAGGMPMEECKKDARFNSFGDCEASKFNYLLTVWKILSVAKEKMKLIPYLDDYELDKVDRSLSMVSGKAKEKFEKSGKGPTNPDISFPLTQNTPYIKPKEDESQPVIQPGNDRPLDIDDRRPGVPGVELTRDR